MLGIFEEQAKLVQKEYKKQLAEKEAEEKKRLEAKRRKEEQLKKESSAIYEVTDEEAEHLQNEIDAEKWVENILNILNSKFSLINWLTCFKEKNLCSCERNRDWNFKAAGWWGR